jgi:putative ABC transport system permease protein
MHKWLQKFAYRIEIRWWVFALTGAIVLVVALLTVGFQSYRAASKNPVEALRYE